MRKILTIGLLILGGATVSSAAAIRIDFDKAGRPSTEVSETGWNAWAVTDSASVSRTFGGVTFTLSMAGSGGTSLTSDWYKAGILTPYYARLTCDGTTVAGGDAGGALKLVISGLSAGGHSLLTYHNGVSGNALAEMNVDLDGVRKVTKLVPTNRSTNPDSAATAYVSFTATAGKSVTVLFSPNLSSSSAYKNVILNALGLDVPNAAAQASGAVPEHRDWHVNADAGSATLSWVAGTGAVGHGIYFGTDSATVLNATTSTSSVYKGKQTATTWTATSLSNLKTYWWRVDETDANGVVTPGQLWAFSPRHLAFPGAEGYGRFARGGRGGKVVHVKNLNDAGAGSLREAVETDIGPRTIVFDVSGVIKLASRLTLSSSNVTIAGQTAPGKGICVRAAPFGFSGVSDGIMRFMKIRLGAGQTFDGTGLQGSDHCIFDHNSVSWTIDESFSSRSGKNITLQRTMLAEALNIAGHQNYPAGTMHGYAATISGDVGSFHHNLLAHNDGRNWSLGGGLDANGYYAGRMDIFNNVVYNWNDRPTDGGAHEVNFVNNYYKPGPATSFKMALNNQWDGFPGTQKYWCHGNLVTGAFGDTTKANNGCQSSANGNAGVVNPDPWATAAFFPSYATVQTAVNAYKDVLSDVGATMPVFDDHDVRMVKETWDSSYTYKGSISGLKGLIDNETDAGGYESYPALVRASSFDSDGDGLPDWWETLIGTSNASANFSDANADAVGDGYTNLERYLEWMANPQATAKVGETVKVNLAPLSRGYMATPTWKAGTNSCATLSVTDSVLSITPTKACGITYVPFTVTDGTGASKTRSIGLYAQPGAVGMGLSAAHRMQWELLPKAVALRTEVPGTLTLRDLAGRTLRSVSGSGRLVLDMGGAHGLLVASFQGEGVREERVVQALR